MSLPLTRRIAQAALLVAAGAAPVVATVGTASAADLPQTADLGGLTQLDSDSLAGQVQSVTHEAGQRLGGTGNRGISRGVPNAFDTVGATAGAAIPEANKLAGATAEQAGSTTDTTRGMASDGAQRSIAPLGGVGPLGALTHGGLPTGQLPTGQLPAGLPLADLGQQAGTQHRLAGAPAAPTTRAIGGLGGLGGLGGGNPLSSVLGKIGGTPLTPQAAPQAAPQSAPQGGSPAQAPQANPLQGLQGGPLQGLQGGPLQGLQGGGLQGLHV